MKYFLSLFLLFASLNLKAQAQYHIDASKVSKTFATDFLKMGNAGPKGKELLINNWYMSLGGKPIVPVMGEVHYSRYPREQWEDILLKMKANGITIIASYVLWIHHEEIEGQFEWTGNKDLRYFAKLCQKHGLFFYPRLGPWCHAEVRNGGTPEWLIEKKYITDRANESVYQSYVDKLYGQIANQLTGLYYKDGGPVVGVQLENEYRKGKAGEAHILWLKETALKHGINVPMYTVTGWDNASVPANGEVIPLFGGYPEAPWAASLEPSKKNVAFEFEERRDDDTIGNEMGTKKESNGLDLSKFPFFTCELGIGNQITYHRRPILDAQDGLSIATTKIGSGSNLPGYYVFAGGVNPIGTYTTLEENQDETGYWNEYPDLSYDFQAAIRETGEIAPAYHQVKKLHYFLKSFGNLLAPTLPVIGQTKDKTTDFQYAVRTSPQASFLFGSNYYRNVQKSKHEAVQFNLTLASGTIVFPSQAMTIPDSSVFIFPVKFPLNTVTLNYATAQLLGTIQQKNRIDWLFFQQKGIEPELSLDATKIEKIEANHAKVQLRKDGTYLVSGIKSGLDGTVIKIVAKNGQLQQLIFLSPEEANQVWMFEDKTKTHWFVSSANMYLNDGDLKVFTTKNKAEFISLNENTNLSLPSKRQGAYQLYEVSTTAVKPTFSVAQQPLLANALWIKASVDEINGKNKLWHKAFVKEFSLNNPSQIKSAKLLLVSELNLQMQFNKVPVNQAIQPAVLNQIDLTGYLKKGANDLVLDIPFEAGTKGFIAKIIIEYFNSDKIEINSDNSWLTLDRYVLPTPQTPIKGLKPVTLMDRPSTEKTTAELSDIYAIDVKNDYAEQLNALYLKMNYIGDKAKCRINHRLIADNFNNGQEMAIDLQKMGYQADVQVLKMELEPLKPHYKILFDKVPSPEELNKTGIKSLALIPEYQWKIVVN